MTVLVVAVKGTPQSRPQRPRPPRPDEVAFPQKSTNGKKKPSPPPGAEKRPGSAEGSFVPSELSNTRWIWDDNCKDDRPPFGLGRWIQVRLEECPIAFNDPNFHSHEYFCE